VRRVAIGLACVFAGCGVFVGFAKPAWSLLTPGGSSGNSKPSIEEQVNTWPSLPRDSRYSCSFLLVPIAGSISLHDCRYEGVHLTVIAETAR
jgi:hypothetical protein